MRIVHFEHEGRVRFGRRDGDVIGIFADEAGRDWDALAEALAAGRVPQTEMDVQATIVRLLPPIPRTGRVICIGLNYADHAAEGGHALPTYPAVFQRGPDSLVGHEDALRKPVQSDQFDYEAELAVVIGRRARHVSAADAHRHILGYACFNDGSLRDYQRRSSQWAMGKNFDRSGSLGPEIVTADELPGGTAGLAVITRVNGRVLQSGSTADMIFPVPLLIEQLTEVMTLHPGDVIATGTPAGVGFARKPPVWLKPGDVCEIEIERIGILRNTIVEDDWMSSEHAADRGVG